MGCGIDVNRTPAIHRIAIACENTIREDGRRTCQLDRASVTVCTARVPSEITPDKGDRGIVQVQSSRAIGRGILIISQVAIGHGTYGVLPFHGPSLITG